MQALILAGGLGTRLRPLTFNTPKPIVPIGNQPFLLRQLKLLKDAGVEDITVSLSYKPETIKKTLGDGSSLGVKLRYLVETEPMGTAGAFKFAADRIKETTIVLNGDILTDVDLRETVKQHRKNKAKATIVLTRVKEPSAYDLVEIDGSGEVLRFIEKPDEEEITCLGVDTINAGIYVLEPEVLDLIPADKRISFEQFVFPKLLDERAVFYGHISEGYWIDIGTVRTYLKAHRDLLSGKIKGHPWAYARETRIPTHSRVVSRSILGKECRIEFGAQILNSVIGDNVSIGSGAVIKNSVIWSGASIGNKARLLNSVVGKGSRVGKGVSLQSGSVLGDETRVADAADRPERTHQFLEYRPRLAKIRSRLIKATAMLGRLQR